MMEREESEDAWYSKLITTAPVETPVKSEDDVTTGVSPDGEGLSTAVPWGLHQREFLLFQGPRSGPGMTWENTTHFSRILHDCHDWGDMEITVVAGEHTMKHSKIDLANMRDYHWACILRRLAAVEGRTQNLAIDNAQMPPPQPRGWDHMRRADCYFAQKVAGPLPWNQPCMGLGQPAQKIIIPHKSLPR